MSTTPGTKPDFNVTAMDSASGQKSGQLGAGWKNADGSITIRLGAGAVLDHRLTVRLWPTASAPATPPAPTRAAAPARPPRVASFDDMDDDIPF